MDEETLRKNFEVWAATENYCLRFLEDIRKYDYSDTQSAWDGWLESARRADRKARIECAEICRNHSIEATKCYAKIRATIKDDT